MRVTSMVLAACATLACGGGKKGPSPQAHLVAVVGDGASLVSGEVLDVTVRAEDASGRPLAGTEVSFAVETGGGTIAPPSAATDPDGLARARWSLGAAAGGNRLRASAPGLLPVVLEATGLANPVALVEPVAGDRRSAAAGATIQVSARLRSGSGAPVAGLSASCTVEAGGGASPPARPISDATGLVTCDWTLGATPRLENRLSISAGAAAPRTFTAWTGVPSQIVIQPTGARQDVTGLVDAPFGIRWVVAVTSPFEVASVTVQVGGLQTPLAFGLAGGLVPAWTGFTPGDGLPRGVTVARLTATDVRGNQGDLFLWFDVDRPPVITVAEPLDGSLARPDVAVSASCTDDDPAGCTSLTVLVEGTPRLGGTGSASGTLSLAAYEGRPVTLAFVAHDSAGHTVIAAKVVWVESSPGLALVGAAPGEVLDATPDRALFRLPGAVGLATLATGAAATVSTGAGELESGFVTPAGAAFVTTPDFHLHHEAWAWAPGSGPASLGTLRDAAGLRAAGPYVLLDRGDPGAPGSLVRRDLGTGDEVAVSVASSALRSDLAASGDVAFVEEPGLDLWRYRDGASPLLRLTQGTRVPVRPRTDGSRVLYAAEVTPGDLRAILWDGAEQQLGASACLVDAACLALDGAAAAFTRPSATGIPQVWRLATGPAEQVSFFSAPSRLEAVTADGTVVFTSGATRWRAVPGAADAQAVGSANGTVVQRGERVLVLLGRSVLEVVP